MIIPVEKVMEIGSEFWLDTNPDKTIRKLPAWLDKFGDTVITSSGRGAISLMIDQLEPVNKTVLLPSYICESMIIPFTEKGFKCHYYKVDGKLSPNLDSVKSYKDIGVFLHMGYFGFPTNSELEEVLLDFKKQSTIIVEDVTHSLFSDMCRLSQNDFYVGSIRKWFGVPSGGFLSSTKPLSEKKLTVNHSFSEIRREGLTIKNEYIKTNSIYLKDAANKQFVKAEEMLDQDVSPYAADEISIDLMHGLNAEELRKKRRKNFQYLNQGMSSVSFIQPIFTELEPGICPLFFPVMIQKDRNSIQKKLAEEKIYCPVHWPLSSMVENYMGDGSFRLYETLLSIPCDQRYALEDMEKILKALNSLG